MTHIYLIKGFFDELISGFNVNSPAKKRRNDVPPNAQGKLSDCTPRIGMSCDFVLRLIFISFCLPTISNLFSTVTVINYNHCNYINNFCHS